ncbi:hypothetical protein QTP86_019582, partial [Hemibagrus guttatus]
MWNLKVPLQGTYLTFTLCLLIYGAHQSLTLVSMILVCPSHVTSRHVTSKDDPGTVLTPFIHCLPLIPTILGSRVTGSLCLSQASLGIKAGYTLDGVPTHHRAHTHSHSLTQSHTTDNLEMPINLPRMSLDWGRKPEYPEETPKAEHANSTHTAEAGIEPPTLE